jgi:methylmalonyl-CoA/ethylmalonyl-CoA epimerase
MPYKLKAKRSSFFHRSFLNDPNDPNHHNEHNDLNDPNDPNQQKGGAMKVLKIDHLGVAVNSIDRGKEFWTDVLGLEFEGSETVEEQKVTTAFFPVGESEVELLESTAPDGPIARYLEKKGEGIQHVAFRVENIESALLELKEKGIRLIDEKPRKGAGGAKIVFLHPKSTNGVLVELCQRDD